MKMETPAEKPAERLTKNKNPKKVEAGQKGAAARKALLEQLRKKAGDKTPAEPAPTKSPPVAGSWLPYAVFAGAVVLGAVLFSSAQKPRAPETVLDRQTDPFYMR